MALSESVEPFGVKQNSEKRVCSVDLFGEYSKQTSQRLHTGHELLAFNPVVAQARHLGPQLRYDGGFSADNSVRISSTHSLLLVQQGLVVGDPAKVQN